MPSPSDLPLPEARLRFVDPATGKNENPGTLESPWKSLGHAVQQLEPGDTLVLRAGVYHEHVNLARSGTADSPITIRSHPGELAVVDGGLREFQTEPESAWEICPGGAAGEYRSVRSYPDLGGDDEHTNVLGNFEESMVPLHGYRFLGDLRSDNPYWNITSKTADQQHVYCGPGLWYSPKTGRIHVRLAHTRLPGLGSDNYRGETDPRRLRLIVAGHRGGPVFRLENTRHVRLQDLVLRGARDATLELDEASDIEMDGLTVYGGNPVIRVRDSRRIRMQDCACRGLAAPWTFRGSLKYRGIESRLLSASEWDPTGRDTRDLEIAHCEFTDSVDGIFIGNVSRVSFHHNLLDNVSDDGIFLTAGTGYDGATVGGNVRIFQNLLSRCLTTFAFGVGHGRQRTLPSGKQVGKGVQIYRNVFDYRRPVMYHWPQGPDDVQEITSLGRFASDHGSPLWEPMWIYHNTILAGVPPRYDYGTSGLGQAVRPGTARRVFNNIVCQTRGMVGQSLPGPGADFQGDGNLFWSASDGPKFRGDLFAKFRKSAAFGRSKEGYPPGWTAGDTFADPGFVSYDRDWHHRVDLRLHPGSPAIDTGIAIPGEWPDPMRGKDRGAPDLGAIPLGHAPWPVGQRGRLSVFGTPVRTSPRPAMRDWELPTPSTHEEKLTRPRVLLLQGYPAFDAPLLAFAFRREGASVHEVERTWVNPSEFHRYRVVAIDGSFVRAGIKPTTFGGADVSEIRKFVHRGGCLILMRERTDLFGTAPGNRFLEELFGKGPREVNPKVEVLQPKHPWVRHLSEGRPADWLASKGISPLHSARGTCLLGSSAGASILHVSRLGEGRVVYIGWSVAASLPSGRAPATLEQESRFREQMDIILQLARESIQNHGR